MGAMTAQMPLPLRPGGATPIGEAACLVSDEQGGAVFVWGTLWWSWQDGDEAGRRLAAVQLAVAKIARRVQIAAAFEVTPETVWRWCRDYERDGIGGLAPAKPGPKGAWKLTDEVVEQIVALDAHGLTQAKIAGQVGGVVVLGAAGAARRGGGHRPVIAGRCRQRRDRRYRHRAGRADGGAGPLRHTAAMRPACRSTPR